MCVCTLNSCRFDIFMMSRFVLKIYFAKVRAEKVMIIWICLTDVLHGVHS